MPDLTVSFTGTDVPILREAAQQLRGRTTTSDERMHRAAALVEGARDGRREILVRAIEAGPSIRERYGRGAAGLKVMAAELKGLPAYLRVKAHEDLIALDVPTMLERLLEELSEFEHLAGYPFRLTWRTRAGTSGGRTVMGTCRAISERERLTYDGPGPAPFWEITLALDVWLLCTEAERWRLLHHEMAHADLDFGDDEEGDATPKPTTKGHDVEDFVSTMGRFGPEFIGELALADAAAAHPTTAKKREEWAVGPNGQGLLFAPWNPL